MGGVVGLVEEPSLRDNQVADILVIGTDAKNQRIFDRARAEADGLMHIQYRRRVHDARHLLIDCLLVLAGKEVVVKNALPR